MALNKKINYPNGTSAEYHRILPETITANGATIASYVSKAIRDANPQAYLSKKPINVVIPKAIFETGNVFTYIYDQAVLSKKVKKLKTAEKKETVDGKLVITPAVFEDVETNELCGAVDC